MSNPTLFPELGGEFPEILQNTDDHRRKTLTIEEWTKKFENQTAHTTDECYTPPAVFEAVKNWVFEKCPQIRGKNVVRPFYPGGDYLHYPYTVDDVVIDNPPFSIVSKIVRFYTNNRIPYFLFAPHLTLFNIKNSTKVVAGASIIYNNGAHVRTSFISNLFDDYEIIACPDLYQRIEASNDTGNKKHGKRLNKYIYPDEVFTVSKIQQLIVLNKSIKVRRKECLLADELEMQKAYKKSIYGNGYFVTSAKAQEFIRLKEEAEREMRLGIGFCNDTDEPGVIRWQLSENEKRIIDKLNKQNDGQRDQTQDF